MINYFILNVIPWRGFVLKLIKLNPCFCLCATSQFRLLTLRWSTGTGTHGTERPIHFCEPENIFELKLTSRKLNLNYNIFLML